MPYLPPGRLIGGYERGIRHLAASGVSPRRHVRILYGLERIVVGAVVRAFLAGVRSDAETGSP